MNTESNNSKDDFINPLSRYRGDFSPGNLTFNANLQEFAQRVSFICNLETNGKVSAEVAYEQIKQLWSQLKSSKKELLDNPNLDRD